MRTHGVDTDNGTNHLAITFQSFVIIKMDVVDCHKTCSRIFRDSTYTEGKLYAVWNRCPEEPVNCNNECRNHNNEVVE